MYIDRVPTGSARVVRARVEGAHGHRFAVYKRPGRCRSGIRGAVRFINDPEEYRRHRAGCRLVPRDALRAATRVTRRVARADLALPVRSDKRNGRDVVLIHPVYSDSSVGPRTVGASGGDDRVGRVDDPARSGTRADRGEMSRPHRHRVRSHLRRRGTVRLRRTAGRARTVAGCARARSRSRIGRSSVSKTAGGRSWRRAPRRALRRWPPARRRRRS